MNRQFRKKMLVSVDLLYAILFFIVLKAVQGTVRA